MKLIIEFGLETISMSITATFTVSPDVVMNYIALGGISEFDEVYYGHVESHLKT